MLQKFLRYVLVGFLLFLGLPGLFYWSQPAVGNDTQASAIRQPLWSTELVTQAAPLATANQLFVLTEGPDIDFKTVQALDATSGKVQWVSQLPVRKLLGAEGDTLYASTAEGAALVDVKTGKPKGIVKFDSPNIEFDDRAIAGFQGAIIGGIEEMTAESTPVNSIFRAEIFARTPDKQLWTFTPPIDTLIGIAVAHGFVQPKIQDGILFLPLLVEASGDRIQQFNALDAATGKVLWTWNAPEELWSAPLLGDTIYPSFYNDTPTQQASRLVALDLKTGKERWSYNITGKAKAASDREVFIWEATSNRGNHVVVLDKQTGKFLRDLYLEREDTREESNLEISGNTLYVADLQIENVTLGFYGSADNHSWLNALDTQTGHLLWRTPTLLHSHINQPAIVGDRLFLSNFVVDPEGKGVVQAFSNEAKNEASNGNGRL